MLMNWEPYEYSTLMENYIRFSYPYNVVLETLTDYYRNNFEILYSHETLNFWVDLLTVIDLNCLILRFWPKFNYCDYVIINHFYWSGTSKNFKEIIKFEISMFKKEKELVRMLLDCVSKNYNVKKIYGLK